VGQLGQPIMKYLPLSVKTFDEAGVPEKEKG
jgi:hypothetical protein